MVTQGACLSVLEELMADIVTEATLEVVVGLGKGDLIVTEGDFNAIVIVVFGNKGVTGVVGVVGVEFEDDCGIITLKMTCFEPVGDVSSGR